MDYLTTQQLDDFNNPLAFARARTARVGQSVIGSISARGAIRTSDIEASYRLVTGALERLETLEGNLRTMLDLAQSARYARGSSRKVKEIYGKLRSLSAGFDQVVDAIQFDGRPIFAGSKTSLDLGPGTRPLDMDVSKLMTYGENSLDLSTSSESAKISIGYRTEDLIVNDSYDIIGLDIEEASFISGSNSALELESGQYKVQISYEGPDSTVEIRSMEGGLIESKSGVDLSGNGREWVDFDNGVRLTFSKENFFSSFDKYAYETNGPAELTATMNYERIDTHTLRTEESAGPDSISMLYTPELSIAGTSLSLSDPAMAPVNAGKSALESGYYNLEIEYHGENSIVRLTDSLGRLKAFDYDIDLSAEGSTELDLGVGFSINLDNSSFATDGASLTVPIEFIKEPPAIDEFDFSDYAKKIEAAIDLVIEQYEMVDEARAQIEEVNATRNSANTSGAPSVIAFNNSGALSVLTGGGSSSLFKPASAAARLSTLSNQLFSTTTALPVQGNQTSEQLASLQNTGSSNSWLGTFS